MSATRRLAAVPSRPVFALAALVGVLAVGACEYREPTPKFGYETNPVACRDRVDNDYDGLVDCEDPDCIFTSNFCGEEVPRDYPGQEREDTFEKCTDNIDNDFDGQFDCGARSCQAIPEVCCFKEFDNESCSDGLDNDQNGFADCGDFQCRNGIFVTVCRENRFSGTCGDGIDNDNDGRIDCLDDGCDGAEECNEAQFSFACGDAFDNDGDGLIDCDDPDCAGASECSCAAQGTCGPENNDAVCADGVDNDGNGFVDCEDFSCSMEPNVTVCAAENTLETCTDGIDQDGNGFVDCQDFSCSGPRAADDAAEVCFAVEENTLEECSDGEDNDLDGFVDCGDFSCSQPAEIHVEGVVVNQAALDYCLPRLENDFAKCSDGIDNDGNGFTDCGDFSCRSSDDIRVRLACQESVGDTPIEVDARCSDGIDNDQDGFIDCDDWDCSWNPLTTVCQPPGQRLCEGDP